MITGLDRSCRAELIGFASPIGRLSAILRITDEPTANIATAVVPVELSKPSEGASGTAEMMIPRSEVRARALRAETEPVRLVPSLGGGTLLEELLAADFDGTSVHRLALVLTTALRAGALASALSSRLVDSTRSGHGLGRAQRHRERRRPESTRNRHKELSA